MVDSLYKCALIGCGYRSDGHADAYRHITRGRLVAACSSDPAKLAAFADKWSIDGRYNDAADMLARVKPDVLHVVTKPTRRAELLKLADAHDVPAVIIEKPIAMQGEDYRELVALAAKLRTKVCVNHQLHFHPRRVALEKHVKDGGIGEVRFIDATARLNLAAQGTHVLELIGAFNGFAPVTHVFGQVAGGAGLDADNGHVAPDQCQASLAYGNGVRAHLLCGENAPKVVADATEPMHKRIAVHGTRGLVEWTMHGYTMTAADGTLETGTHDYFEQDVLGQAALTEAAFDWIEDEARTHPLNLHAALADFQTVLAIYTSAIEHRPITLPFEPGDNLLRRLRTAVAR